MKDRMRACATFAALAVVAAALAGCSVVAAGGNAAPAAAAPTSAIQDFNAGQKLQGTGRCDRAIPLYLSAIKKSAIYVNAYRFAGDCYLTLGNPTAAIEYYNKAIPIDPRNFYLYFSRGGAEATIGMNGAAIADYNTAFQYAPPVRDTYIAIAQQFSNIADFYDALKAMDKAVALSPNDPSLYEARGNMHLTAKQYTDAYNDYRKAIAVAPYKAYQASINADLANVYAGQGDYDRAFGYMRTAIRLQPNNPHLYVLSGGMHYNAGPDHYADAIGLYRQVFRLVKRGDDVRAAHEGIGDVLMAENQPAAAITEYRQAIPFSADPSGLKAKIKAAQKAEQS